MKTYVLATLIFLGCGTDQEINTSKKQNVMEAKSCTDMLKSDSISILSEVDLSNCDLQSLLSEFNLNLSDSVKGYLGTSQQPLSWWKTRTDAGVEITFWANADDLVKIDITRAYKESNDIDLFKESNGDPEIKLDYYFDIMRMKNLASVYPSKGIVIFYELQESAVYKWSYFAPTTSNYYQEHLHPMNAPREFKEH